MYKKSASGQKFKLRWQTRRQNKTRYILIQGALYYAIFMGNFVYWPVTLLSESGFNLKYYIICIIAMGISGIIFGNINFNNYEKQYQQILKWEEEEKLSQSS